MKNKLIHYLVMSMGMLCSSCDDYMVISPKNYQCVAPSIKVNIVGTWDFESTYINGYIEGAPKKVGVVTFNMDGSINDPDNLFEDVLDGYEVMSKRYNPDVYYESAAYKGSVFKVFQKISIGEQVTLFTLVSNECDKIHLRLFLSQNNGLGFTLTRKR